MELNYKEFGQGDPIIILHGLFGTLDNWQTIAKQLAKDYTVFILDLRNHGRSPHSNEFDYEVMANDLYNFMIGHWIYEAHIIGHSMGGKTAMQFAIHHPEMVEKLIVVDIAPKKYKGGHQAIFDALFSLNLKLLKSRKEADGFLKSNIEDYGIRQFLLKNLSRNKAGVYNWKMNLPAIYKNYQKILDTIESDDKFEEEVLFIKGEKSDYIKNDELGLIYNLFPKAKIKEVKDAGHWVHAEAPKDLLTLVYDFLKG